MNKCLYCGKDVKNKYCNVSCQNKDRTGKYKKERIDLFLICKLCGKKFIQTIIKDSKRVSIKTFCSAKCANTRSMSDNTKNKISIILKKYNGRKTFILTENIRSYFNKIKLNKFYYRKCPSCGEYFYTYRNTYCSKSCVSKFSGRLGGLKSAEIQSINRRSKNEIYFAELCKTIFNDVKVNKRIFNGWDADVIIEDCKLAVLWNGKWHYEKLAAKHSVLQVQNRDKIKINEIIKCGYVPYIIKDMGKYDPDFVNTEFEKLKNYINNIAGWCN